MIFAHDVNKIVDMANDCAQRGIAIAFTVGAQKGVAEIDPCHAAAVADSQQLPIGQITRLESQRMGVGMGGDQR